MTPNGAPRPSTKIWRFVPLLMIVLHPHSMHLLPQTSLIPLLKTGVQTATGSKPFLLQAFPLTARAQHIEDPVEHPPIWQRRSAWTAGGLFLRAQLCNPFPKAIGNFPQRGITHQTLLAGCLLITYNSASGVSFC